MQWVMAIIIGHARVKMVLVSHSQADKKERVLIMFFICWMCIYSTRVCAYVFMLSLNTVYIQQWYQELWNSLLAAYSSWGLMSLVKPPVDFQVEVIQLAIHFHKQNPSINVPGSGVYYITSWSGFAIPCQPWLGKIQKM